ncbi:hypothetical protein [Mucilaginibacter sp.]
MENKGIQSRGEIQHSFFKVKTHSIADILAAGGATFFAVKMGKDWENLAARLKDFQQEAFLTDEDAKSALESLKNNA